MPSEYKHICLYFTEEDVVVYHTAQKRPMRSPQRSQQWRYQGKPVFIVPTADIASEFRPNQKYGHLVQRILDGLSSWELGDDPIETGHSEQLSLPAIVTQNDRRKPVWGIHAGHRARRPQLSPFVHGTGEIEVTKSLTIELAGTPGWPRLTRAYPGEYIPPLPWQSSAADADSNVDECRDYWQVHSYIYDRSLIVRGTQTNTVPEWYK